MTENSEHKGLQTRSNKKKNCTAQNRC